MQKILNISTEFQFDGNIRCERVDIAAKYDFEIANWLEQHGVDVEYRSNGDGMSFEGLMYGNVVTDELCRRIEELA